MIEGSHSCYLWIYPRLDQSAIVFDYDITTVSYRDLTANLSEDMQLYGIQHKAKITHSPQNYSWQHKADNQAHRNLFLLQKHHKPPQA